MDELMTDKAGEALLKVCQVVHEKLPPGYRFACAIIDADGRYATACSPGLSNQQASEMFGTVEEVGEVSKHIITKRN